jgi:hypothetical protein
LKAESNYYETLKGNVKVGVCCYFGVQGTAGKGEGNPVQVKERGGKREQTTAASAAAIRFFKVATH